MEEPWLRGPVPGIIAGLQPFAHEMMFAKEEIEQLIASIREAPAGRPSGGGRVIFAQSHRVFAGLMVARAGWAGRKRLSVESK